MVLKVNDFTWSQNNEYVFINLPLKGKQKRDVDIIITDSYIKVNFTPYILECFLFDLINDLHSKVVFVDGMVLFSLKKSNPTSWAALNNDTFADRQAAQQRRLEETEKFRAKLNETEKENAEQRNDGNKYSLREMMELEGQQKERIRGYKEREASAAMEELAAWKRSQRAVEAQGQSQRAVAVQGRPQRAVEAQGRPRSSDNRLVPLQPVRQCGVIEFEFTPRVFPTPERESVKAQEDEWLKAQMAIKSRNTAKVTAGMTPEESNADYLKAKGNSFFAVGDYGAALAAFSLGLEVNSDLFELYSNRAACHIKMRNFFKAVDDASRALALLSPPVPQNVRSRTKAHLRRGAALCQLEMYREGLLDYEAALKLDPDNDSIRRDIDRLKAI